MNIEAVLFDLDGVLVNSIPSHGKAWQYIMRKLGVEVDPFVAPLTEGLHSRRIAQLIFQAAGKNDALAMPLEELDRFLDEKRAYYRSIVGQVAISDEIVKVIEKVKSRGIKIALVTSTSKVNLDHIVTIEQQKLFDVILWAGAVKRSKPHPDPYLTAASKLDVDPARCLVVENAPLGVRAARAAGTWCVGVTTTVEEEDLQEAHIVLETVKELAIDAKWNGILECMDQYGDPGVLQPSETLIAPISAKIINQV